MNRINYKIEDFEGPLDLLLVLIVHSSLAYCSPRGQV